MGAMPWFHEVPWQPDAKAALHQLQVGLFQATFNFDRDLETWREQATAALRQEENSGDRFGLVEIYTNALKNVERVAAGPTPSDPLEQLAILRQVLDAGEGLGSILDVTDINATGGPHITRILPTDEVARLTGSEKPTHAQVENAIHALNDQLDRGNSFALVIHDKNGVPTHWFFIGNTVD